MIYVVFNEYEATYSLEKKNYIPGVNEEHAKPVHTPTTLMIFQQTFILGEYSLVFSSEM